MNHPMKEKPNSVIYLDHAATCPMRPVAIRAMLQALQDDWGNASQTYPIGQRAKAALDMARTELADSIHASWHEIFLTSGGTESDNWALTGTAEAYQSKGKHIIVSGVEHHAILHTCEYLRSRGFDVTILPVTQEGIVKPEALAKVLDARPDTILVSVMWANNEVGTIEPIEKLCKYTHDHGALFHTDAVQAYGKIPIDVDRVPVDLLSVSAHKIGGPKGIGFLYIRKGVQPQSLLHGGAQESGRRAGTENVPAAVAFAAAAGEAVSGMKTQQQIEARLQQYFYQQLREHFPQALWNGPVPDLPAAEDDPITDPVSAARLSNNVSISFPGIRADTILMNLDLAGICASGGSACTSGALDPSHVIMAMTGDPARARGTIRFTLGPENTREEIDHTITVLESILARLQQKK